MEACGWKRDLERKVRNGAISELTLGWLLGGLVGWKWVLEEIEGSAEVPGRKVHERTPE